MCPCGKSKLYLECCGKFITGTAIPQTPEELMRSRYTAYTQANVDYIAKTMKAPANKDFDAETAKAWASRVNWIKLDVVMAKQDNNRGIVEFLAHYADENKSYVLHEISEFHFEDNHWYYIDGRASERKALASTQKSQKNRQKSKKS